MTQRLEMVIAEKPNCEILAEIASIVISDSPCLEK